MPAARVLIVDDDPGMRQMLEVLMRRAGHEVLAVSGGKAALERLGGTSDYDLVITDLVMPEVGGMEVLSAAKRVNVDCQVIVITAYATTEAAVEAMRRGAYDYVQKPFANDELKITVEKALEKRALLRENVDLRAKVEGRFRLGDLLGKSEAMARVFDVCRKVAQTRTNVLVTGESGTGKELLARAMHFSGPRADSPFVAVNCGAIAESLIESELFGHEKGAFTGAIAARRGLFAEASGGTLFLDEVTELAATMQVKLLRAIQERTIRVVGSTTELQVDVRIVAASNRDIEAEVQRGGFRQDLYYRLNVIRVHLPPLRTRQGDIPLLADHFLDKYCREQRKPRVKLTAEALQRLMRYSFPGNVRELENLIERAITLSPAGVDIGVEPFGALTETTREVPIESVLGTGLSLDAMIEDIERRALTEALQRSGGVRKRAADLLGISFRSLRYRLRKYGLGSAEDAEEEGEGGPGPAGRPRARRVTKTVTAPRDRVQKGRKNAAPPGGTILARDRLPVRKKDAGFTLTELMVVVAIIGILASVAVLSFRRYTVRVKVGEAYSMLGLIKAREEVYRAEFNQYCGAAYHPNGGTTATAQTQSWGTGAAVPTAWQQVGVRPDQDLYFVYQVSAGSPGANPNPGFDATLGAPPGHPLADDFYFVATAKADLDGDGADSAFELCSTCRSVYVERTAADYEGE